MSVASPQPIIRPTYSMPRITPFINPWLYPQRLDKYTLDLYHCNGGAGVVLVDEAGNHNGAFKGVGEPAWSRGFKRAFGPYCIDFDGANDWLNLGTDIWTAAQLAKGTIDFLFYPKATSIARRVFDFEARIFFQWIAGNKIRFYLQDAGSLKQTDTTTVFTINRWYHIFLRWNGTVMSVGVNGVEESSALAGIPNLDVDSRTWYLGADYTGGGNCNCRLDEFRISNIWRNYPIAKVCP